MKIISIDSDEFKPGTYRAVVVSSGGLDLKRFDSGDPKTDMLAALQFCGDEGLMASSSVDHFISDDPVAAEPIRQLLNR